MKQLFFILFLSIVAKNNFAQSMINQSDEDLKFNIMVDINYGTRNSNVYLGETYNYQELDSLGKIIVLGNLNWRNIPQRKWIFFLGDITKNGKEDWYSGKVKKGKLDGTWVYSYICTRIFNKGREKNIGPCPNI